MSRPPRLPDPLYAGPRQSQRGNNDTRTPAPNVGAPFKTNGRNGDSLENTQGRAARFEDEKRRIIECLFSKRDDDGVQVESYITHVRVAEDAAYPSNPPPPDADPANKKNRVIMISVRRTGRVKVHKGRENPTGSFSIGKTWNLDELGGILSYTHYVPRSSQEELEKQWANGVGFIATLGKAYYWQASTPKEKDFFIASLVKIYRKYTGGRMPELKGFSNQELEKLGGQTPILQQTASQSTISLESPPPIPAASDRRPQSPYSSKTQGSDPNVDQGLRLRSQSRNEALPPRDVQRLPAPLEPLRSPARARGRDDDQFRANDNSTTPGSFGLLPPNSQNANGASSIQPSAQSSQTSLPLSERPSGAVANGLTTRPKVPFTESARSTSSIQSSISRPTTAASEQKASEQRLDKPVLSEETLPERRKQSAPGAEVKPGTRSRAPSEPTSQFATPAMSPSELSPEVPAIATVGGNASILLSSQAVEKDYFNQATVTSATKVSGPEEKVSSPPPAAAPITPSAPSGDVISPTAEDSPKEEFRPGLGPMIKKKSAKDIAGQFRKAAMAAGAFQPRQGGGAARFKALQDKEKLSNEPDGITGVVPAPLFRGQSAEKVPPTPTVPITPIQPPTPAPAEPVPITTPPTNLSTPEKPAMRENLHVKDEISKTKAPEQQKPQSRTVQERPPSPDKARSRSPQRRKRQRQQAEISKYCSSLGLDPQILDGKGAEFNDLLTEFGWEGRLVEYRRLDDFESEIKREIGRAQATGWLGHVEQQEGKVQELAKAFDRAIEECEELDGLFTLYSHELDTLNADIEYIEAQSQGLQVQTANQKLLQTELQNLLNTLTIPEHELRDLRKPLSEASSSIERVEKSLALLYKALITIDPDIRQNKVRQANGAVDRSGVGVYADSEIGQMRAVREKKDTYREDAATFVGNFNYLVTRVFKRIDPRDSEDTNRSTLSATYLEVKGIQKLRQELWMYNALMLFVREVNSYEWQTLINSYDMNLKQSYQDQFREFVMGQRRTIYKPNGEELEALFTTVEKEKAEEGIASSAARKLTVRRGKNPRPSTVKQDVSSRRDGRPEAWEAFEAILSQQSRVISEEQNFIVQLFHINSQANADFAEIVAIRAPGERIVPNLATKQSYDPDRNMAKIVRNSVDNIFSFWPADLQGMLDWVLSIDQLQGVGVLNALEQCLATYEDTNQEFITSHLRSLHERLTGLFHKFVDEQIRAIEETKVKVKKRKGVISFMRVFPLFSTTIEQMMRMDVSSKDALEVRFIVNEAYNKILKAMWESLTFIAKDNPTAGGGGVAVQASAPSSGDPEDKEALNYHILLIENMSHYMEDVDPHNNIVLEEWADRAKHDFLTHMAQYVDAVIRRPLGKWLDFLESTEAMMRTADGVSANSTGIANKPSHSRSAAKKILSAHDAKEIRKGIETLKKRVEKHFGDVDDATTSALSKGLILKVFDECSARYASAWERMKMIVDKVYDGNLEIDWRKEEMVSLFKTPVGLTK